MKEPGGRKKKYGPKFESDPASGLVLVAPFDGIGGARRALEILKIPVALYISIDSDQDCAEVVKNQWPDVEIGDPGELDEEVMHTTVGALEDLLKQFPGLDTGLVIGGPPCQC